MPSVTPENLLLLINRLFLAGLILLMLGGFIIVLRSGFFSLFLEGVSKMKSMFFRQARVLESDLYAGKPGKDANKNSTLPKRVLLAALAPGSFLLLLSIGLTAYYYLV